MTTGLRGRFPETAALVFLVAWALILLAPLVGLIAASFLDSKGVRIVFEPNLEAYGKLFESGRWTVTVRTLRIAATVTAIELAVAIPFALWLARPGRSALLRAMVLALLTVPFFLSSAAKTIVWRAVLGKFGLANTALTWMGAIDEPLDWLLFSEFAVHLGLIGPYFPTMVFPIFLAAAMLDQDLLQASRDLGADEFHTFRYVTLPLLSPGIFAGVAFTFVPMLGADIVPALLGGGHVQLLGGSVHSLLTALNYPVAAATSTFVLAMLALLLLAFRALAPNLADFGEAFQGLRR